MPSITNNTENTRRIAYPHLSGIQVFFGIHAVGIHMIRIVHISLTEVVVG